MMKHTRLGISVAADKCVKGEHHISEGTNCQLSLEVPPSAYRVCLDLFVPLPFRSERQRAWVRHWQSRDLPAQYVCFVASARRPQYGAQCQHIRVLPGMRASCVPVLMEPKNRE